MTTETAWFRHTPYDGSSKPFSIGLGLLDLKDWIEAGEHLPLYLDEKERLFAANRDAVFREEAETRPAQQEVLDLLTAHLTERFPDIYRREGARMHIVPASRTVDLESGEAPLLTASKLVQEDLCLMRDGPGGYRLAAASLCFPSSWSLAEKFGRTLDGLHENVPGYGENLGGRMNRIFANMKTELPTTRLNWSLYADRELHHPAPKSRPRNWFEQGAEAAFVRVERQTLRRLPGSGDVLFTIGIHIDPVAAFRTHPEGPRLAAALRDDILRLDEDQLAYKALKEARDRMVGALAKIAAQG